MYEFDFEKDYIPFAGEIIEENKKENINAESNSKLSAGEFKMPIEQVAVSAIVSMVTLCQMTCMAVIKKINE